MPGRILILNGPSSSGKSTTAALIQARMPGPWWHTGMDSLSAMLPSDGAKRELCGVESFVAALHRFVADLARNSHDVIYETGLLEQSWTDDLLAHSAGLPLYPVEFVCALDEVRRRESGRPDRMDGYSESLYHALKGRFPTSLTVDAAQLTPEERAARIVEYVEHGSPYVPPSSLSPLRQEPEAKV